MRYLWIIIFCFVSAKSQESLYDSAFKKAMADSVITEDEQALLDLFSVSQDTTWKPTGKVVPIEKSQPSAGINQNGRWRLIYSTMAIGNGLYGVGIPYLLEAENSNTYVGFQLVAAAAGFYLSYNKTQSMDLSLGRVSFIEKGASMALLSFFPLQATIGIKNWFDFDPHFRIGLGYMMAVTPIGAYYGNRLFERWQPSDGQAVLINFGSGLAALNGIALHRILLGTLDVDSEREFNLSYRLFAALGYGGAIAGTYYSHELLKDKSLSVGDAYLVQGSTVLGAYVAVQTIAIADIRNEKAVILTGVSIINAFAWQGVQSVSEVDFTEGDAAIIALGTVAANGIWRGLNIMVDMGLSSDIESAVDIATSLIGYYSTYRSVKSRRLSNKEAGDSTNPLGFKFSPTLLGRIDDVVPGMAIQLKF